MYDFNKHFTFGLLLYAVVAAFSSVAAAETLLRGPYLQQGDSDSVIIKWRSNVATDSYVEFGTSQGNLNMSTANSTVTTEHEIEITGLNPDTRYYYNIGDSAGVLAGGDADHFFETSPVRGTAAATRVWVVGDAGTANSNQLAVYNAYRNFTGGTYTDMFLMLGDNAYNDGTDSEYQAAVFNMYAEILRQTPVWATLGNHDGHSADSSSQSGPYYDIFTFPRNAEVGGVASGTEAYYSYEYGNIHFIVLDSYETSRSTSGAMMSWLQSDLQNVTADWLVAFWHHPPYTKGSHNSDSESNLIDMRQNFNPVLESYGVDLILGGHSHSYERTKLIDGHYGSSNTFNSSHEIDAGSGRVDGSGAYVKNGNMPNSGAVYAVNGASGKTSGGSLNHPAMYTSLNQLGSMVLDFNGQTLDVKYLNSSGNVTDYFTIAKDTTPPSPPAAPSNLAAIADSSSSISLSWTDNADNETGFDIERSLNGSNWSNVGSAGINSTSYIDSGLTASSTYYYRIRSNNSAGTSGYSNTANATTDESSPIEMVTLQNGLNNYVGTQDSYIGSAVTGTNFGSANHFDADGDDGSNGELVALVQWDVSSISASVNVTDVEVTLEVFNLSPGSYGLYAMNGFWTEGSVTWGNANVSSNQGVLVGTLYPDPTGSYAVILNASGVNLVQDWVEGSVSNNGFLIRSTGTTDGVDMRASEFATVSSRPALTVTYETGVTQTFPDAASNLSAVALGHDSIDLSWTDNADNETGFDIERSLDAFSWSLIASVGANTSSYTNTGLVEGTIYYYRVRAYNSVGESSFSNVAGVTTEQNNNPVSVVLRDGLNGYSGAQDTWVASGKTGNNYGSSTNVEADGSDGSNGELVSLLQWDVSSLPPGAMVTDVKVTIRVSNRSRGTYGFYAMNTGWSENNATWGNTNITSNQGMQIASIDPDPTGVYTLTLNSAGIALVQGWLDGSANNGMMVRTTGTSDGMIFHSSEYGTSSQRPTLTVTYQ